MPVRYAETVRGFPGVKQAMGGSWIAVKVPGRDAKFFNTTGVEARPFVEMHYELVAPGEQKEAFIADRQGAMVSEEVAEENGWLLGDKFTLQGRSERIELELNVRTIFHSSRHGYGQRAVFLHWEYLNEARPQGDRDQIGIISAEIDDPSQGARIAKAIDIHFDTREHQTFTMEDQALNAALVGRFGALLEAMDVVSFFVLGVVLLILGNTMATGVRERTAEYAVLRAIGFAPGHIVAFILGEAALLGCAGGLVAAAIAYPLIEMPISRYLEESMDFLPLQVPLSAGGGSLILGLGLGLLAASLSAYKTARLAVVNALRHVG